MNKMFLIVIILSSLAEAKMLSLVHYDPFKKAKVLLKSKIRNVYPRVHRRTIFRIDAILNHKVYINGKFYDVGKVVNSYKILTIGDKYIRVIKDGKIFIIPLIKSNYLDDSIDKINLF